MKEFEGSSWANSRNAMRPRPEAQTVRDVCARILGALGVPIVYGAAVGHTPRPMLTVPLGVRARLKAVGEGELEILEPAVVP